MTETLTHIDEQGDVRMVDVSQKADTERVAVAEGFIAMKPETLELITSGAAAKGDVLACARVAGVMAAKKTASSFRCAIRSISRRRKCHASRCVRAIARTAWWASTS